MKKSLKRCQNQVHHASVIKILMCFDMPMLKFVTCVLIVFCTNENSFCFILKIHANCRIRRVYFSDRLYSEDELPAEFKLYLPVQNKAKVYSPTFVFLLSLTIQLCK